MSQELALLIERSADLKRDLVQFLHGPRFERPLAAALLEAADPEAELDETGAIDWFAAAPPAGGETVVDRFVASLPDLEADREMLLSWRDPVEGIFEIRSRDGDAIILLNLLDDLEYPTSRTQSGPGGWTEPTACWATATPGRMVTLMTPHMTARRAFITPWRYHPLPIVRYY
jgi:hypothetical protein